MDFNTEEKLDITAPLDTISIDGISSPIAHHLFGFYNEGDGGGDLFPITGAPANTPVSVKQSASNNAMSDLANINDQNVSIAFSNFQSIDPASFSALFDSPLPSTPQPGPQPQHGPSHHPQLRPPSSYIPPPQQQFNGEVFTIDDIDDVIQPRNQFRMSQMPIQQSMPIQEEYTQLHNSMYLQTMTPKNSPEIHGYLANGHNVNRSMSELDGMIDGLNQGMHGNSSQDQMRRIYSTGDMQAMQGSVNMGGDGVLFGLAEETANFRVGKLTPEQRKEKIDRYIRKRNERNFNKKIKYACRKTLADSRPRVRGRFAKNDEYEDPRCIRSCSNDCFDATVKEDEDLLDTSNLLEDEDEYFL